MRGTGVWSLVILHHGSLVSGDIEKSLFVHSYTSCAVDTLCKNPQLREDITAEMRLVAHPCVPFHQ
jgi:hypothetical protein